MILEFLLSVLGFILTIFIVVGVHEAAHFVTARCLGIKVLRFSIGFGKALYRWTDKKGTEYVIAPIPLGGYVKLLDETEGPVSEKEKPLAFNRQATWKRFLVVLAGPLSNIVMAVLFYWLIFIIGFETPIPIVGSIDAHSIAAKAGLRPHEEIVQVDGHETLSWPAIATRLILHTGDQDHSTLTVMHFDDGTKEEPRQLHLDLSHWQMSKLKPDPLSSLGIYPYNPPVPLVVGFIKAGSPAEHSPLAMGDKIEAINGKPVHTWEDVLNVIQKKPDSSAEFLVRRGKHQEHLNVALGHRYTLLLHKQGYLGVGPHFDYPANLIRNIQYNPIHAIGHALSSVWQLCVLNVILFGKLITLKLSVYSLGGPITIFESASSALQYGLVPFLSFLAFLNVALGVINLFPIPGLDGGHLLFQALETIFRKPVPQRVQMLCYRLGFIFLIFILVQALTNDILRIWGAS